MTDIELLNLLEENGYKATLKNLETLREGLKNGTITLEDQEELNEDKKDRLFKKYGPEDSAAEVEGKKGYTGPIVLSLFGTFLGGIIWAIIRHRSNEDADERARYLRKKMEQDPECMKIINDIKNEINNNEKPNREKLKNYKAELKNALRNVKYGVNEKALSESYIESIFMEESSNNKENKYIIKSHIDHFLKEYLTESFDYKVSEVETLTEAQKAETMKDIAKVVINSIIDKLSDIDTSSADKSRGEIKALRELPELQSAITQLEAILERSENYKPECKKYLGTVIKSILYLNQYSSVFKNAYRNKNTLLIIKYQSLILSIISSVSYLISTMVDFGLASVTLKQNIQIEEIAPLKSLDEFNKSIESGEFKIVTNDVFTIREYYNEVPVEEMSKLYEASNIIDLVVNGVKNFYNSLENNNQVTSLIYKATGIIVLLISVRDVLASLASMKTKASDMLGAIKNFANVNLGGSLKALSSFASKFTSDAEVASDMSKHEIEDENRKLATQLRAIQAAPVIDIAPEDRVDSKQADNSGDLFSFNF